MNHDQHITMTVRHNPDGRPRCQLCDLDTRTLVNIKQSPVPVCESCCRAIAVQTILSLLCEVKPFELRLVDQLVGRSRLDAAEKGGAS